MAKEKNFYYKAIGQSSHDVTGSCHLIKSDKYTILLDYGMYQTNDVKQDHKINHKRHKDIKPKHIDYIFISHLHADHTGLLPALYRDGCRAPIYITKNSKSLLRVMLMDSVHIMEKEQEKYGFTPLYNEQDVETTLKYIREVDYGKHYIEEDLSIIFLSAQHIINSAQIIVEFKENNQIKKVGYTGDIGQYGRHKTFLKDFEPIHNVDLLIGEATYSNATRLNKSKDKCKDVEKIKTVISRAIKDKAKVLMPVFSLNRLEDILSTLYDIYGQDDTFKVPIIIDTPLGIKIAKEWKKSIEYDNDYWQDVWVWANVQKSETFKESLAWQELKGTMIILASSGMMTAGRSIAWGKKLLPNSKDHIIFCGFSSKKSLASMIKNYRANERIKIEGVYYKNKAQVTTLNSFSSHMDYEQLLQYYTNVNYNKICLVHSEQDSKIKFAEELRARLSKADKCSKVVATNYETKIHF